MLLVHSRGPCECIDCSTVIVFYSMFLCLFVIVRCMAIGQDYVKKKFTDDQTGMPGMLFAWVSRSRD